LKTRSRRRNESARPKKVTFGYYTMLVKMVAVARVQFAWRVGFMSALLVNQHMGVLKRAGVRKRFASKPGLFVLLLFRRCQRKLR
jgi:hypothetical protein